MEEQYDAIIVGAGFGGVYNLIRLRNLGLRCKLIEAGADFGGVWHANAYPGARVDIDIPYYEFSLPEIWKEWTWSEKFPARKEMQAYFAFVDKKLDLRKDCRFNSLVNQARWDERSHTWHVTIYGQDGSYEATARYLILCTGSVSKRYTPNWKGLDSFQGVWTHTSQWPEEGIETRGKRVGVIGTGASGVQVIQEIGRHVEHLTVFQRTPNMAIPMRQRRIDRAIQDHFKPVYDELHRLSFASHMGGPAIPIPRSILEDSAEERKKTLEKLWEKGGFTFFIYNYWDVMVNKESNEVLYAFWRKKVGERVKDPEKRALLAPVVPPHPFCAKRPSLEQHYYEVFNQDNVDLVDVNENPIVEITPKGVKTADKEHELDVLVLATGFDTFSGPLMGIDICGLHDKTIQDHWQNGALTYLGMTIDNFPNLFFVYGPQGPTALANGPKSIEVQGSWVAQTIDYLWRHGITKFTPTSHAALAYKKHINAMYDLTLYTQAKSWYNGGNIPGKKCEAYAYAGGLENYRKEIMEEIERGYPGFEREVLTRSRL